MVQIVKFEGWRELEKALADLPLATGRSALQRGLKKVAAPIADDWKDRAPRDEGHLEHSIIVGPSSRLTGRQKKDAKAEGKFLAEIHVGTADPAGQQQEFGNVNHPAQPSGRPAWDGNKDKTLTDMGKFLWDEIEKSAARRAKKLARG